MAMHGAAMGDAYPLGLHDVSQHAGFPYHPHSAPTMLPVATGDPLATDIPEGAIEKSLQDAAFERCNRFAVVPSQIQAGSAGLLLVVDATFAGADAVAKHVWWKVDAKKLQGCDKVAISSGFELSFKGEQMPFKVMLCPKTAAEGRGGFRKAKGRGSVKLKCEEEPSADTNAVVTFQISVGAVGTDGKAEMTSRGPVTHDFAQLGVAGLKTGQDDWNFKKIVDEATGSFVVRLDIIVGSL